MVGSDEYLHAPGYGPTRQLAPCEWRIVSINLSPYDSPFVLFSQAEMKTFGVSIR